MFGAGPLSGGCRADRDDIQNEYWCEAASPEREAGTKRLHADAMTGATVQTPKPNEINGENRRAVSDGPRRPDLSSPATSTDTACSERAVLLSLAATLDPGDRHVPA